MPHNKPLGEVCSLNDIKNFFEQNKRMYMTTSDSIKIIKPRDKTAYDDLNYEIDYQRSVIKNTDDTATSNLI